MNKKGQWQVLLNPQAIISIIFLIAFLSIMAQLIPSIFNQNCPKCEDCSPYKNQLSSCQQELENPQVVYINQTIEIPVDRVIEKPVYLTNEGTSSKVIVSISLIISFFITLFSFKIKLPKKLEEELENLEEIIKIIKFGSLILTILIFIKLLIVFNLIGV